MANKITDPAPLQLPGSDTVPTARIGRRGSRRQRQVTNSLSAAFVTETGISILATIGSKRRPRTIAVCGIVKV
jgi:hypothetical protein